MKFYLVIDNATESIVARVRATDDEDLTAVTQSVAMKYGKDWIYGDSPRLPRLRIVEVTETKFDAAISLRMWS